MNNSQIMELCLSLMRADAESDVIAVLRDAGYWDNRAAWRYYGDYENNFNTIGNQQSRPDAALVEKLVNSVDARLMNECLARGIDPEGAGAPQTVQQAVATFFDEGVSPTSQTAGRISDWTDFKRTTVARGITLAATGASPREGRPCFTISDSGEGQTPAMMPQTFLSLTRSNKLRIPFVQGKFNMGGTGVLKFCGNHNLQLILSRRNPAALAGKPPSGFDEDWGFTLVRRENPEDGRRSSVYTYLAPVGSDRAPGKGEVLHFASGEMPIFPDGRDPYVRLANWGTLVKLYEYSAAGYSNTHILRRDGLLSRLDILLPDIALPIRLHECRLSFRGHEGSFETTLTGLRVRLEDDRGQNLEEGFPSSSPMSAAGEHMAVTIFAFRKDKAETYRKNEGIIFTLNGQTQGQLTKDFFARKEAGRLNYIADSILVTVDCSKFSTRAREDLFMNSRDRLSGGELRTEIERALQSLLKEHPGLRALKEQRRREEIEAKLGDSKPLEDILEALLKQSPTLSELFLLGRKLSNPFKSTQVQAAAAPFKGKRYPTFFKFKDLAYGVELQRTAMANHRLRVPYASDAVNDYFDRRIDNGEFTLFIVDGSSRRPVASYVGPTLHNGIATLTLDLPRESKAGDTIYFVSEVMDRSRIEPFVNQFRVTVEAESPKETKTSNGVNRPRHSRKDGNDKPSPPGIALPNIREVYEAEWSSKKPPFDQQTALRVVISEEEDDGSDQDVYDFFINMDNIYLKSEMKSGKQPVEIALARWKYGLVLLGLALLHQDAQDTKSKTVQINESEQENGSQNVRVEDKIEQFTKAVGQVLVPMIASLGDLDVEDMPALGNSGEAT